MPGSSSLGYLSTGSVNPEMQFQAMSAPQRHAMMAVPPPPCPPATTPTIAVPRTRLTLWNAAMFVFHASLATVTLVLGNRDLTVPVYRTVIDFRYVNGTEDVDEGERPWELVPVYATGGELHFTWLTAVFFLLSASFHLLNATVLRRYYLAQLEACYTPTRWIEYFFSAPVMIVLIAYSLGIRNRETLIAIAALIATTMPFGYWVEVEGRPESADAWCQPLSRRLLPWVVGHVPQLAAWVLIVVRFYDGAMTDEDRAPAFVHVILWFELLLFFSFGVASLLSQVRAPREFYKGELAFQVLSLVSKGLLGILLLANVLMLSRFDDLYD